MVSMKTFTKALFSLLNHVLLERCQAAGLIYNNPRFPNFIYDTLEDGSEPPKPGLKLITINKHK